MVSSYSLIIVGGGIVGMTIAREAAISKKFKKILILEKETTLGAHSSSRNSGIMHSGFYYAPNSQKAFFCSEANKLIRNYCIRNNINLLKCGKVVVENSEKENDVLNELFDRGKKNGCEIYLLDKKKLSSIEPLAKTKKQFIWSPNTWSASPKELIEKLESELNLRNVEILTQKKIVKNSNSTLTDQNGANYKYEFIINAAGGYSLEIAKMMGIKSDLKLLPFKGLYLKSRKKFKLFKTNIYPVPDIEQPFLGIHTTLTSDFYLKLGPTALPVLSPENYSLFEGIDIKCSIPILFNQLNLFFNNHFKYREIALKEVKYILKKNIINQAQKLTSFDLKKVDFEWNVPGIRSQLYNSSKQKLEMDFVYKQFKNQFHILNSNSPAWTCSFGTAKFIINKILG